MILIIIAVVGVLLLCEKFAESSDYGFVAGDNSIWHDEYEEEMKNLRKQAKENNITLSVREIDMVANKINKKAKAFERILCIVFISLCVFTVLWLMFGSYEKNETTKYSLLPIQDESILNGQSDKTYYIAESVNKDNSYMFFYENEKSPEKMEIVADNIIKYENIDCEPCVVKEMKTNVLKYELLQKILFFRFDNKETLEENYKFYVPKENYIEIFSY